MASIAQNQKIEQKEISALLKKFEGERTGLKTGGAASAQENGLDCFRNQGLLIPLFRQSDRKMLHRRHDSGRRAL